MRFVLLLVAAVIAVVAGVAALKFTGGGKQESTPVVDGAAIQKSADVATVEVLVAREQIDVGAVIKEEMIAKQPWPSHLVLESFVVAGGSDGDVIGRVARSTFMPQEPLLKTRLANPNDPSFLAATLPEGKRAVTLGTDTVAGVAGYIFPGDRVDVLMTHNVPNQLVTQRSGVRNSASREPAYSEVLVSNTRVLAVNLRDGGGDRDRARSSTAPSSITVEVPEEVVQQLRLAEKLGTLSLALRSLKDVDRIDAPAPTSLENLTRVELSKSGDVSGVRMVRGVHSDSELQEEIELQRSLRQMSPTLDYNAGNINPAQQ
ncbi:MAG: Flp pilus assembly protein CpaB [Alphaproteobacteria bacterium]